MRPENLPEIAAAMAAAGVARLELTGPGVRLVLARGASAEPRAIGNEAETAAPEAETVAVSAPGVGTFLRAHPLHDRPLAADGDAVGAGQALAVLQVGPLLLPVVAPTAAVVVEAAVEDGTLVGYGDRLLDLLPQD
jgi:acetyl-CoA carboxylase biotin carboxyl carrier protein